MAEYFPLIVFNNLFRFTNTTDKITTSYAEK